MRIAMLGAGSMGSAFGGLLALGGHEVWLVDVNRPHVEAVAEGGLEITAGARSKRAHPRATVAARDAGDVDLTMVWCKAADTAAALEASGSLFGAETIACTLQNGLGHVERLLALVGPERLVYGVTGFAARFVRPGVVAISDDAWDGDPSTWVGSAQLDAASTVADALTLAGIPAEVCVDVDHYVWSKLATACAIAPLSAIGRVRQDVLLRDPDAVALMRGLQAEVIAVAGARGIGLDAEDVWKRSVAIFDAAGAHIGSMLQDVLACRPTEIDAFCGAVVRVGRDAGVPTPLNDAALRFTKVIEHNAAEQLSR